VNILHQNILIKNNFFPRISERIFKFWKLIGLEAFIWMIGLVYLGLIPSSNSTHFTICPLANLGLEFCPGCGLGNSISYLFRGDIVASIHSHPLGIFAIIIIITRIISLIKNNRRRYA